MNDISIRIENVSKQYRLDMVREKYYTIRDYLTDVIKAPIRNFRRLSGKTISEKELFWALKDINLEIKKGDVLGIIGRNGAGKSTLLKVISRITPPTTGRVEIYGRVGSLLEVGTGFHPELTGRENIYLNGSILGMKKYEIDKKFDEIVQFAEIEKFLDTPVKRYSSGMYVRLAFAVAAHMETEILLVDEVLAVGDINFQKKCLGKMGEVSKEGRTVLFVSHNMPMITALCERGIFLEWGQIKRIGNIAEVVLDYYSNDFSSSAYFNLSKTGRKIGNEYASLVEGSIRNRRGDVTSEFELGEPVFIQMRYTILKQNQNINYVPNFHFFTQDGICAFVSNPQLPFCHEEGEYMAECCIPSDLLNDHTYSVGLALTSYFSSGNMLVNFYEKTILNFMVKDNLENRNGFAGAIPGVIRPKLNWKIEKS